jgi:hypothetical protein
MIQSIQCRFCCEEAYSTCDCQQCEAIRNTFFCQHAKGCEDAYAKQKEMTLRIEQLKLKSGAL